MFAAYNMPKPDWLPRPRLNHKPQHALDTIFQAVKVDKVGSWRCGKFKHFVSQVSSEKDFQWERGLRSISEIHGCAAASSFRACHSPGLYRLRRGETLGPIYDMLITGNPKKMEARSPADRCVWCLRVLPAPVVRDCGFPNPRQQGFGRTSGCSEPSHAIGCLCTRGE